MKKYKYSISYRKYNEVMKFEDERGAKGLLEAENKEDLYKKLKDLYPTLTHYFYTKEMI